ncbi:Peroxisomal adenine nucleotide transporter 1 [Cytospora mali]|uniref:Peroxisomal adenine nucleotide transporter 1 n=1 Tax=Cytospora mali TaxID=578113 RepID=A0A194V6Q7_CYTMA|nr:Peroxisomal adenine nucleotide transporter 1 [Valsa mali var. pyri (nom. inval.)]
MSADSFLPAIGHAVSGAAGTAISTTATYPLDLVNTRLKVQRQLRRDGTIPSSSSSSSPSAEYRGIIDAFAKMHKQEGGLGAFYAGLGSDITKGVADSFLFFLFYAWFRSRATTTTGGPRRLPAWEELAVGAAAGACARLFTTPIGNVVTRKQTASLTAPGDGDRDRDRDRDLSVWEMLAEIRAERGVLGLWAGYSATLVLTLNPSITFYLQSVLKKALVDSGREGESGGATFLVAAVSKVVATAVTYPFQIAKAISQVSAPEPSASEEEEKHRLVAGRDIGRSDSKAGGLSRRLHTLAQGTIFATVIRMGRAEGVSALYDGLSGELLKAFLNHGTTMLSKEIVHKLIVRLYFFILAIIRVSPAAQALLRRRSSENLRRLRNVKIAEKLARIKDGTLIFNVLERTQRLIVTK